MKSIGKSRRSFIGNLLGGGIGLGAFSSLSFTRKSDASREAGHSPPVIREVDICVLGGSCIGVFAAIIAAREGASVAIVEKQNAFGGVATNSMVNIWHSLYDSEFNQPIIAGLTLETMNRLSMRNAVVFTPRNPSRAYTFNSQELKIELDEMVLESGIVPYLHTLFSEPYLDGDGKLAGVIVDNKSGRGIIRAKYFIDTTGDGDLCHRLGLESHTSDRLQPPTTCAYMEGWNTGEFNELLKQHKEEFNIPEGFIWGSTIPSTQVHMVAGTRVYEVNCSAAEELTRAEIEGRRQIRAIMDMVRKYGQGVKPALVALPSHIGIRETRHIKCLYHVSDEDALYGKRFDDAIANGSYRFDIHHHDKPGITFYYLDGTELYNRPGYPSESKRWRTDTGQYATFYQVPLRSIIPPRYSNLILAGRMLDCDTLAFSGIRVMVNMNQLGEAAGITAYLALHQGKAIRDVDPKEVRAQLSNAGSIII